MREKMSMEDRAKQFMSFEALGGLDEALQAKEKIVVPRIELDDSRKEDISDTLEKIKPMDVVRVIYLFREEYLEMTGVVAKLDFENLFIQVVMNKIPFEDIYDIEIQNNVSI